LNNRYDSLKTTPNLATLLEAGQRRIMELTAMGAALPEVLKAIVLFIEGLEDNLRCSILILDESGKHLNLGAAPSLPDEYNNSIDGLAIGPSVGSCGAAAALGHEVVVEDISSHPNWSPYKHLILVHGLKACWSFPIFSLNQRILGTFAIYFNKCRGPNAEERKWFDIATHVASLALNQFSMINSLRIAKEKAESADLAKSAFLANVSHELRTPLTSVLGFSALLERANLTTGERSYLGAITRNCSQLNQIISDILDLSVIEAKGIVYRIYPTKLGDLISETLASLQIAAERKGIKLERLGDCKRNPVINTDPIRARQIFTNIIGNAIQFTDTGSVTVEITCPQVSDQIEIEVADTGLGIAQVDQERLFRRFSQVDESLSRNNQGTGLGLVLSRQYAQGLGGDVQLTKSIPGLGSIFTIRLAKKKTPDTTLEHSLAGEGTSGKSQVKAGDLQNLNILLVEDNADLQDLGLINLEELGAYVELASNGKQAVEKALSGNFDIVLMDLQMPILNGYEATKQLRGLGYDKPIIALSAHAMSDSKVKSLEAGCNEHLNKPINWRQTVSRLRKFVEEPV